MKKFTADFETATWLENETYVWAWATCEIENEENIKYGNNIESFLEYCKEEKNSIFYFHNLKFDGSFIIWHLLKNGFKHVEKKEDIENNTFTTLISDMGMFYNIVVYFEKENKKVHKVTFIDSLKLIPFSVDKIAKDFKLPISKLEIDYNKPRSRYHVLTKEEKDYITNDVLIMSKALKIMFDYEINKITIASSALNNYKEIISKNLFNHYFPVLDREIDKDLRQSYKGGFTYLNPIYKEKDINEDIVNLDVNSLYPYVLYEKLLPYGEPIFFEGKYKDDIIYPLYIQMITCSFKIKKNKLPTIQIKDSLFFTANEYLESSSDEEICLVLTNIDLKLFLEHYNTKNLRYECGWKFHGIKGLFTDYIEKWIKAKNEGTKTGNLALRTVAKLMLNSLYGKFATTLEVQSKIPYMGEDNILHYTLSEKEEKNGIYLPVASFVTAYAREKTIRTSQAIKEYSIKKYGKDKYIYSDTDSIKTTLSVEELEKICDIDSIKLGAWKNEGIATKGRFIRQKCYIEQIDDKMHITCSGLPAKSYDKVNWKNFKTGFSCPKLTHKNVVGGVKLVESEFTIKEEKLKKSIKKI